MDLLVKIKIATQSPGVKTGLSSLATKILASGLSDRARKPPSSLSVILTLFCVAPEYVVTMALLLAMAITIRSKTWASG